MPHVALVASSGIRVRERAMLELGMRLPDLATRAAAIAALPSLGLLTLGAMTPAHWEASWHEIDGGQETPAGVGACASVEALVDRVVRSRPTLVAISALTASVETAYAIAQRLRGEGVLTALGGLHATACPREALAYVDAVVIGDGESTWPELLADAERGVLRPIYSSRAAGRAPFDLALAPLPRWDLLGPAPRRRFTLQTQRGCPFACDFCGASRLLGPFREKPVGRVRAELGAILALDPHPAIELADDNTFAGRRDAMALLEALGDSGGRWFTETDWRLGERPEVVDRLAASGCVQLLVGIESTVHLHPGMGAKQADLGRIMGSIERIQEAGVAVIGCFIVGSDGETRGSMDTLAAMLERLPLADVQLTLVTPFPGTELHARLEREGRLLRRGWSSHTLFDVTFVPDRMSVADLEVGFRELVGRTFGPEASRRRAEVRRSAWSRNPVMRAAARRAPATASKPPADGTT